MLWIRIRIWSDPHHFSGLGTGLAPGHADPDPADSDRFQCQEHEKVNKIYFFSTKSHHVVQVSLNYDIFDIDEKDKNIVNWQSCDLVKQKKIGFSNLG